MNNQFPYDLQWKSDGSPMSVDAILNLDGSGSPMHGIVLLGSQIAAPPLSSISENGRPLHIGPGSSVMTTRINPSPPSPHSVTLDSNQVARYNRSVPQFLTDISHHESNVLRWLLNSRPDLNLARRVLTTGGIQGSAGGYSDVFIGYCTDANGTQMKVAVKKLRVSIRDDAKLEKALARELYIWSKLSHPRILPLEGFYFGHDHYPSMVSKWMEKGTVLKYIQDNPDANILSLTIGIAEGIKYLHNDLGVIHSDIKPDNILISDDGSPVLCDFGIARMIEASKTFALVDSKSTLCGTARFMAKELLDPPDSGLATHTKESDIWAFGMTVITLLSRELPYSHLKSDPQVITAILKGQLPTRPTDTATWPSSNFYMWDLCTRCWDSPPSKRPTISLILETLESILKVQKIMLRI